MCPLKVATKKAPLLTLVSHKTVPTIFGTNERRLRQAESLNKAVALNKRKWETDQKQKNIDSSLVPCHKICKINIISKILLIHVALHHLSTNVLYCSLLENKK